MLVIPMVGPSHRGAYHGGRQHANPFGVLMDITPKSSPYPSPMMTPTAAPTGHKMPRPAGLVGVQCYVPTSPTSCQTSTTRHLVTASPRHRVVTTTPQSTLGSGFMQQRSPTLRKSPEYIDIPSPVSAATTMVPPSPALSMISLNGGYRSPKIFGMGSPQFQQASPSVSFERHSLLVDLDQFTLEAPLVPLEGPASKEKRDRTTSGESLLSGLTLGEMGLGLIGDKPDASRTPVRKSFSSTMFTAAMMGLPENQVPRAPPTPSSRPEGSPLIAPRSPAWTAVAAPRARRGPKEPRSRSVQVLSNTTSGNGQPTAASLDDMYYEQRACSGMRGGRNTKHAWSVKATRSRNFQVDKRRDQSERDRARNGAGLEDFEEDLE